MDERTIRALEALPVDLRHPRIPRMIALALEEDLLPRGDLPPDLVRSDVTSFATVSPGTFLHGRIFAKQDGVAAGLPVAAAVFAFVDAELTAEILVPEGARVERGTLLMRISGPGRSMLVAERTALNFLGRMAGIATLTRRFVDAIAGTNATILDTRKTAPGQRLLDKYAVRKGGGQNHRMGLYDMALIKDNHIDGAGSLKAAVMGVRARFGDEIPVEIEVKDLDELSAALQLPVDRILLDNMSLEDMRDAVKLRNASHAAHGMSPIQLEASGNVSLETVRGIAETGVDYISSGALTHSVQVFDISLRIEP